jgi:hypothetical protein
MSEKKKSPESDTAKKTRMSRRDFARRAVLAAATAAVVPSNLLGEPGTTTAPAPQAAQQPEEPKLSPESRAEVQAKIEAIFRKYGNRLSEEQRADVRRLTREGQKSLESLRAFPLDNADQPATVFQLYPEARFAERRTHARRRPAR